MRDYSIVAAAVAWCQPKNETVTELGKRNSFHRANAARRH